MKELFKALADFQLDYPTVLKKTAGYGHKHADLHFYYESYYSIPHKVVYLLFRSL